MMASVDEGVCRSLSGAEKRVAELVEELLDEGVEVELVHLPAKKFHPRRVLLGRNLHESNLTAACSCTYSSGRAARGSA